MPNEPIKLKPMTKKELKESLLYRINRYLEEAEKEHDRADCRFQDSKARYWQGRIEAFQAIKTFLEMDK